jgi:hypothetical protein
MPIITLKLRNLNTKNDSYFYIKMEDFEQFTLLRFKLTGSFLNDKMKI